MEHVYYVMDIFVWTNPRTEWVKLDESRAKHNLVTNAAQPNQEVMSF